MSFVRGESRFSPWSALIPASWVAGLWIRAVDFLQRHGMRRAWEPPMPVISVGNLTYGGTNKTPFVEMLCRLMAKMGVPVGIVSRGYGGDSRGALIIVDGRSGGLTDEELRRAAGDEPLLLSSRLPGVPVVVSRDRMRGLEAMSKL
ncbi:MAG: tetraacyldisaccharide 4'-kinase, partial [Synergistaceae bacterium]|nr:tetraacyldisaccharide 4'-kinase [Synergistaceae bacterium]